MRIAVHGKEFNRQSASIIERIFQVLSQHKVDLIVSSGFESHLRSAAFKKFKFKTFEPGNPLSKVDLFVSIGGDGTLLDSVTYIGRKEIPVLGINTGRLGFLATTNKDDSEAALLKVFEGAYTLDKRAALKLKQTNQCSENSNYGLNDFSLVKKIRLR